MARHARPRRDRHAWFTRARALLAGGLVLGVGAAMTYASWTDTEYASGSFSASTFNTESSPDGTSWNDNAAAPGAVLKLNASGLSPTVVRAAPLAIRTKTGSVAGSVVLQTPPVPADALALALEYRVYTVSAASGSAGCTTDPSPSAATGWIVGASGSGAGSWSTISTPIPQNSAALPAAAVSAAGTPAWFCFQVRLPANADNGLQGAQSAVSWKFVATSNS